MAVEDELDGEAIDHRPWPLRAAILLGLGALLGVAVHSLSRGPEAFQWTDDPLKAGAAAALASGGMIFGFTLERQRWLWSLVFALAAGLVVGFVTFWNGRPESWSTGEGWRLASALLTAAIAVPLFQASRDAGRWNLDYRAVHAHVLANIVLGFVAWGFVLITVLLVMLLSELFQLIGVVLLHDLLRGAWVPWLLVGGALGAAIGLLRDRAGIVGTLQRAATAILSFFAPILAAGLVIFVIALPFTGLEPLWEQTRSTTPILLACILGAVILINAVIGTGSEEDEARPRVVRWSAAALAAVIFPLAVIAAVSTGKRIAQHGFTPDRLWAAALIAVTIAGAAAYLFSLVRGRAGWPSLLRAFNLRIAIGIGLSALLLALPIISFGAISTRDQTARLQSGRIAPDEFDWAALRYDFGPSGRRAIGRLAASSNPAVRAPARAMLMSQSRWAARAGIEAYVQAPRTMHVFPAGIAVPPDLREAVLGRPGRAGACRGEGECYLLWREAGDSAIAIMDPCGSTAPAHSFPYDCGLKTATLARIGGHWLGPDRDAISIRIPSTREEQESKQALRREALRRGRIEVREVKRRQLFIGDEPVGVEFE